MSNRPSPWNHGQPSPSHDPRASARPPPAPDEAPPKDERKRVEEAAKASEERLCVTFEAAKIGTGEWNLLTDQISLSDSLLYLFGYAPGAWLPSFDEYTARVHPDDQARVRRLVGQALAEKKDSIEIDYRIMRIDGGVRWVTSRAKVFYDGSGPAARIVAAVMDITEIKLLEQRLEERLHFEALLSELSASFANVPASAIEDQIKRWLERLAAFLGADHGSLYQFAGDDAAIERRLTVAVPDAPEAPMLLLPEHVPWIWMRIKSGEALRFARLPDDLPEEATADARSIEAAGVKSLLAIPLTAGGAIVCAMVFKSRRSYRSWTDELVRRLRIAGEVIANAILRTRSEEERRKLAALVEHSTDFIGVTTLEGRVLFINPAGRQMVGLDGIEEVRATYLFDYIAEEDRPRFREHVFPAVMQRGRWEGEMGFRHWGGGALILMLQHMFLVRDDQSQHPLALASISRDITEHRRLEEQLRHAQKLESVGRLAGGVAHDFNNLLTAITGYTEMVMLALPPESPARDDLREISRAAERAATLTRQLLAFARKDIIDPRVIDLNDVMLGLDGMLRRLMGSDIELVMVPAGGLGRVRADLSQLEQVIVNLAVNARDAMPEGGTLTLATSCAAIDERAARKYPGMDPGTYALLTVTDTGSGMSEEAKAHLFEPFFTTKGPGEGTGLGLAMCYGIIQQHGGQIGVTSARGQGTTVSIYLPRVEAPLDARPSQEPPAETLSGTETALLVEDEPTVRAFAARALRQRGYTVLEAAHGAEALRVVRSYPDRIHLMVSDVVMPRMGVMALVERLRVERPEVKVLLMSGYVEMRDGRLDPAIAFLPKPFTADALARKVRDVLDAP